MSLEPLDGRTASLLQENRRKDIEVTHFSRNHVPMTLAALSLFGCRYEGLNEATEGEGRGESLLELVRSHYVEAVIPELNRRPQPSFGKPQDFSVVISRENWKDHLGRLECFSSFCKFFQAEIQQGTVTTVEGLLKEFFTSELQRGIHAAAYHALLRMSFGVLLNDPLEVAFGLGYMCAGFSDIVQFTPMNGSFSSSQDPTQEDLLYEINASIQAVLDAESVKTVSLEGVGSITQRQQFMASLPQFAKLIPNLLRNSAKESPPGSELWEGMLLNISNLYAEFHDFTILHALTSCYALKVMWPWLTREGIQAYWTSVLASFACLLSQLQKGKTWPAPTVVVQVPDSVAHPAAAAETPSSSPSSTTAAWPAAVLFAFQTLVDGRGKYSSSEIEHVLKLIFAADCIRSEVPSLDQKMFDLVIREIRYPAPYL
jgi:hypothetical protein